MKKFTSALAVAAVAATAAGVMISGAGDAAAYGTATPWAPGGVSQDANAVGGIAFYDASGNQIFGGSITAKPFAAYAVGLNKPRAVADNKATLKAYVADPSHTPDAWTNNEQIGSSTTYPNATAPSPINTSPLPVNTGGSADLSLATVASDFTQPATAAGYVNAYEIRLYSSSAGNGVSTTYDYADITINTSTGQWTETWSPDITNAATSGTVTGPSTTNTGTQVTFTDTISPAAAAGTVQFKDNNVNIGTPQTVSGGVATLNYTFTGSSSSHPITAVFTANNQPLQPGYQNNTSNTLNVGVTKVAATSAVSVSHSFGTYTPNPSDGSVPAYTPTTLTATVTPSTAQGSVVFSDNGSTIGTVAVSNGTATLSNYIGFGPGAHSIVAAFQSSDTTSWSNATSSADAFTLGAAAGAAPDTQYISADVAAGSLAITTPYDVNHPLNVGTLLLDSNGTILSNSVAFGSATPLAWTSPTDPLSGTIKVVDTRTGGQNWTASALATHLANQTTAGNFISAQNIGLTGVTVVPLSGNHLTSSNVVPTDNTAASPAVLDGAAGSLGLGGTTAHKFGNSNDPVYGGTGTVGFIGTLTVNAPTSTVPGHYTGTITFTVA